MHTTATMLTDAITSVVGKGCFVAFGLGVAVTFGEGDEVIDGVGLGVGVEVGVSADTVKLTT